jgi:hypothetical protein
MEARLGQSVLLYNVSEPTNNGAIVDVVAPSGSIEKSRIFDFDLVEPTDAAWPNRSVQNGFGVNALPLVVDATIRTYYFHLVSQVSQSPLSKRGMKSMEVHHHRSRRHNHNNINNGLTRRAAGAVPASSSGTGLSAISIATDSSPNSGSALASWIDLLRNSTTTNSPTLC